LKRDKADLETLPRPATRTAETAEHGRESADIYVEEETSTDVNGTREVVRFGGDIHKPTIQEASQRVHKSRFATAVFYTSQHI
jgi:hypothetical protein